ncbi:hypothetical protein B7494_g5145 [Chlorociboria aeruginascens]|nr:hypothetical protein B7494_g5145 [Chlorociboria aeruginascens]
MTTFTPSKRSLARPRPSLLNATSSPNLGSSYSALQTSALRQTALSRKSSLNALNSKSLATIPDSTQDYGLSTVLDEDSPTMGAMTPFSPPRTQGGELEMGDLVDVPGNMHGTVKFIGEVQGKKGTFAGVELSDEFAARGKNNGDVDGISYFSTSIAGAGIFLPINRATRRESRSSQESSVPLTPSTPSFGGFKVANHGSNTFTPPTPSLSKFSKSVGGGRAPSPQLKKSRPSLPRPESPLRRPQLGSRPSIGTPAAKGPTRYASPAPGKFGQSVRGTQDSRDPSKKVGFTPKNGMKSSIGPRSASALGTAQMNYSDDESTPIGTARTTNNGSMGSVSSFNAKMRPASRAHNDDEVERLRAQLEERDRQLKEQAMSLAEMESSLNEVQTLMGGADNNRNNRSSMEDKDATQLRLVIREKNEKIAMLTAEFDAHRADFRSTIDTLEMASTETERVYEKRVEDLLHELRELQERGEDVDSVARQLKQLEELVQELEEGLEDARRGEAEARGEVEFLRGEVERTRSELRREREKAAVTVNGGMSSDSSKEVDQRDDEIRGLKAIIHSLSRDAVPDAGSPNADLQKTPTQRRAPINTADSIEDRLAREKLEREVKELRAVVESKGSREEELERELERLRRGSGGSSQRASAMSTGTVTQDRSSTRDSKGTVVSWRDRDREGPRSPDIHRADTYRRLNTLETMPESDTYSSANESFCELCETSGHDILTCTNMFSNGQDPRDNHAPTQRTGKDVVNQALGLSPKVPHNDYKPAPLSPMKKSPGRTPVRIIPNPMESGPVAGKESGVVNLDKWCGVLLKIKQTPMLSTALQLFKECPNFLDGYSYIIAGFWKGMDMGILIENGAENALNLKTKLGKAQSPLCYIEELDPACVMGPLHKMPAQDPAPSNDVVDDDEDDYMNMVIAEPSKPKEKETYTQRRLRIERESEARGRVKSKAERAADEAAARDAALSTSLLADPKTAASNKGLAMMAKMGFKPGVALGSKDNVNARTEPIAISMKEDRGGIGLDSEKKRKFREEVEREGKKVKAEEGDYRERVRQEREEVRLEGIFRAAMRVAERMDGEKEENTVEEAPTHKKRTISTKPLKQINVLWRGLVRKREEKERDRRIRYDLQQSLSRLPTYEDEDEDKDDKRAMGKELTQYTLVEDLEEEDPELDAFNALDPAERLQKVVEHLRDEYNYCFWCKFSYPDKEMEGCPGITEEDHD